MEELTEGTIVTIERNTGAPLTGAMIVAEKARYLVVKMTGAHVRDTRFVPWGSISQITVTSKAEDDAAT